MPVKPVKIAPSLLAADFTNLSVEIERLSDAGADLIHLDIMDGHYVPNLTFGYPVISQIASISKIPLDAHLMVINPEDYLQSLAEAGVKYISYHPETVYHNHRFIQQIKQKGIKAGWAINPGVSATVLEPIISDLDFVLLMSVNPGYGGQKFIPSVYRKIHLVREMTAGQNGFEIEVDGGVNDENSSRLIESGADILVAGSYIFRSDDYSMAVRSLRNAK